MNFGYGAFSARNWRSEARTRVSEPTFGLKVSRSPVSCSLRTIMDACRACIHSTMNDIPCLEVGNNRISQVTQVYIRSHESESITA